MQAMQLLVVERAMVYDHGKMGILKSVGNKLDTITNLHDIQKVY